MLDSLNLDQIRNNLAIHYHGKGPGRTPIKPLAMLKAQLVKRLLNIISDRRLALWLKQYHKVARAYGFRNRTPSARESIVEAREFLNNLAREYSYNKDSLS